MLHLKALFDNAKEFHNNNDFSQTQWNAKLISQVTFSSVALNEMSELHN